MGTTKPKMSVRVVQLKNVSLITDADVKRYKKLKGSEAKNTYMKITFLKEALVAGGLTDYDLDSDHDEDEEENEDKEK